MSETADTSPSADGGRAAGTVRGVFHHGVTVADVDRALVLYRDILGLELMIDRTTSDQYLRDIHGMPFTAVRMAFLRIPGGIDTIELVQYMGIPTAPAASRAWNPGVGHLCFEVAGIAALHERLRLAGFCALADGPVPVTSGPNRGAQIVKFCDLDGYWIELLQRPAGDSEH